MPLYLYRCADCGAELELLRKLDAPDPRICGFRCALDRWSDQADLRGQGQLERAVTAASQVRPHLTRDAPTAADMAAAGFSTYANEGGGVVRRLGGAGPERVDVGDPGSD